MKEFNNIRYAQCWEDPWILTEALEINSEDNVLSIASGGENTFALLLKGPRSITAIDYNSAQIYLVELKIKAIQILEYDEFLKFVGARPYDHRIEYYRQIRAVLTSAARTFWDNNLNHIQTGIIHIGKFERYFRILRRIILPLIHSKKTIQELVSSNTLDEQRKFYDEKWDSKRWRWLYRIFFSKFIMGLLGRDPIQFKHVKLENISKVLLERTRKGLTRIPVQDNYFLEYILTGSYSDLNHAHPWLQWQNFQKLKDSVDRIRLINTDINEYLETQADNSISKVNLSDIFEYMSEAEYELSLGNLIRIARTGTKLALWTLFVSRGIPELFKETLNIQKQLSEELFKNDKTFFYGSFQVLVVK